MIYASWTKADPFFRRVFEARRALLTASGAAAYVRSTAIFLYPDWWINENTALLEEREQAAHPRLSAGRNRRKPHRRHRGVRPHGRPSHSEVPTLVICARDDLLTPPYFSRELARLIPGAELVELQRGGHCASETNTNEFNDVVLGFISRHS